eukprot:10657346-Alexandrium_andersonii.AAC.1
MLEVVVGGEPAPIRAQRKPEAFPLSVPVGPALPGPDWEEAQRELEGAGGLEDLNGATARVFDLAERAVAARMHLEGTE